MTIPRLTEVFRKTVTEEQSAKLIASHKNALEKRGIDPGSILGRGMEGVVFELSDPKKVLKITGGDAEANLSSIMKGKKLKHVFQVFDVFKFPEGQYGIVKEKLVPLSELEVEEWYAEVDWAFDFPIGNNIDYSSEDKFLSTLKKGIEDAYSSDASERFSRALAGIKKFHVFDMMRELQGLGVSFGDFKTRNVMKRGSDYVLADAGEAEGVPDRDHGGL